MFKVYIVGRWGRREEVARFKTREEAERFASRLREHMRSGLEGLSVEVADDPDFNLVTTLAVVVSLAAIFLHVIDLVLLLYRRRR
jgi:hypothetical protein